ncbi:MAG: hypothetical protein HRT76_03505 [Halieaceae bacterium]|nr:hypothetical protein [Halieaceae bacterium]
MKCILHIGTEKTGTTALQHYLFQHRAHLSDQGFYLCRSVGDRNDRRLAQAMMYDWREDDFFRHAGLNTLEDRKAWRLETVDAFCQEVRAVPAGHHTVLLSSEHFHSRLVNRGEIARLASVLCSVFDDVEVRCYLRRQDEMAISLYSTALIAGHVVDSLLPQESGSFRNRNYFDFERLLQRWSSAFPTARMHPAIYSASAINGGDVVRDYLASIGAGIIENYAPQQTNTSLGAEALQALLKVNRQLATLNARDEAVTRRRAVLEYLRSQPAGDSLLPPRADVEALMQYYEGSNRRCAQLWFGRDALFAEPQRAYPEAGFTGEPQRIEALWQGCAAILQQGNL